MVVELVVIAPKFADEPAPWGMLEDQFPDAFQTLLAAAPVLSEKIGVPFTVAFQQAEKIATLPTSARGKVRRKLGETFFI